MTTRWVVSTEQWMNTVDMCTAVVPRDRISPTVLRAFKLPGQEVVVTRTGFAADTPERMALSTGALVVSGRLPDGAAGLDPFIVARDLTLIRETAVGGLPDALADPERRRQVAVPAGAGVTLAALLARVPRPVLPPFHRRATARRPAWLVSEADALHEPARVTARPDSALPAPDSALRSARRLPTAHMRDGALPPLNTGASA